MAWLKNNELAGVQPRKLQDEPFVDPFYSSDEYSKLQAFEENSEIHSVDERRSFEEGMNAKHTMETVSHGPPVRATRKSNRRRDSSPVKNILSILEMANSALTMVGEGESIESWIIENKLENNKDIHQLAEVCGNLRKLLGPRPVPATTSAHSQGSLESLSQFFLLRNTKQSLVLLAPVEAPFKDKTVQRKVFGFIRRKGTYYPLMCALSGLTPSPPLHPLLLDSKVWTAEVKRLGTFYDLKLHSNGWETRLGPERQGESFASHVEKKLMLFYACRLVAKLDTKFRSLTTQVAKLYKLRRIVPKPEAEIFITRPPCVCCQKFQQEFEEITGISFTITTIRNLGEMLETKDQNGAHTYQHPQSPSHLVSIPQVIITSNPALPALQVSSSGIINSKEAEPDNKSKMRMQRDRLKIAGSTDNRAPGGTISTKRPISAYEAIYEEDKPFRRHKSNVSQAGNSTNIFQRSSPIPSSYGPKSADSSSVGLASERRKQQLHDFGALVKKMKYTY